jgi:sporulation protein YlmC with PRC-barrel domain
MLPTEPDVGAPSRTAAVSPRSEPAKAVYLETVPRTWVSIGTAPNEYVNTDVYNRAGEKIGTVKDILVGPDGKMAAAIISVGRFLGIGERDVAVLFSTLNVEQKDSGRRIVVDVVKDGLQAAPAFERRGQ